MVVNPLFALALASSFTAKDVRPTEESVNRTERTSFCTLCKPDSAVRSFYLAVDQLVRECFSQMQQAPDPQTKTPNVNN